MGDSPRGSGGERREPTFGNASSRAGDDLRLTREDRPGAVPQARRTGGQRVEPSFAPSIRPGEDPLAVDRRRARGAPVAQPVEADEPDATEEPTDAAMSRSRTRSETPAARKGGGKSARKGRSGRRGRSLLGHLAYWSAVAGLWLVIGLVGLIAYHASKLPPIDQLAVPKRPPNIAILAADGSLLANRGETGGRTVTLKELPPYLPKAFVAIEDRRFYDHEGIDPVGIARAVFRNVTRTGSSMQGGSTLTQQLAKNLFLTQERTASRKIQEAILAIWLEHNYSKDQILELYLNRVYFGSGAYGVEAAAQKYFGKSARSATLSEAAILAGLVQAPSRLAPNRNPEAAQARATLVLAAMARDGFITDQMAKIALSNPPEAVRPGGAGSVNYAADYVMDVLDDFIGTIDKDIVVQTTIDPMMQAAAEKALVDELSAKGDKFNVSQGALVAMQPDGAVRALVGGRNYTESQFNRAVAAKRQPGSAFKPFVYLTAVEHGLTPDTVREDSPITIKGWSPENSTKEYRGAVTLRQALALSINTVAVKLAVEVGPKAVVKTAQRLGISSKLEPNASIALGTSEVAPIELVAAYAPFANGGIGVMPYVIRQVKTVSGELVYSRTGTGLGRVLDPSAVAMMNAMLRETLVTGTARRAELPGWEAAGKTGTTQEYRDAWFVGYTGSLVAGVWLGNDDSSATKRVSGSNLPSEVWSRFMKTALAGQPVTPLPGGGPNGWRAILPEPTAPVPPAGVPEVAPGAGAPVAAAPLRPSSGPLVLTPPAPIPMPQPAQVGSIPRPPATVLAPAASQPGTAAPLPPARATATVAQDDALRPPGVIPGAGPATARSSAPQPPPQRNFFDRLFGG
ncbi:transglycosylase domain-containing protein [Alsobacter sp. R-9]